MTPASLIGTLEPYHDDLIMQDDSWGLDEKQLVGLASEEGQRLVENKTSSMPSRRSWTFVDFAGGSR